MVAMLFTAISYGRMANAYPTAGSAYTYVGQELHSALGYLTGWAMVFDYVLNPIISVIFCSKARRAELVVRAIGRLAVCPTCPTGCGPCSSPCSSRA